MPPHNRHVTTRLRFHDLDQAHIHLAALKAVFLEGRTSDARPLRRISALCNAVHIGLRDPYCSTKLARLAECAAVWFSGRSADGGQRHLEQLLDLLDLLQSRVHTIETIRRASRM